jgi:hypothetical protein
MIALFAMDWHWLPMKEGKVWLRMSDTGTTAPFST